jgi:sugar lactone lactonase YvrE
MNHPDRWSLAPLALAVATSSLGLACSSPSSNGNNSTPGTGVQAGSKPGAKDAGLAGAGASDASSSGAGSSDSGVAVDAAPLPVVTNYVPGVTVSTLAGSSVSGTLDGTGAAAQFDNPTGMSLDASGNLLVCDYDDGHVRLVTPAGVVTTIAEATNFVNPFATVVASNGEYFVQTDANSSGVKDTMTGTIWLVTPPTGGGIATPTVVAQSFGRPRSLAPVSGGNLFVADRTQELAETVNVVSGQATVLAGAAGVAGYVDATGASASFNGPVGAAAMADGSFLVTDSGNNVIRRVTPGGVVTTFAGNGQPTLVDGPCASASFNAARGVAVDTSGNVYVSDIGNHVIRMITTDCTVMTLAGDLTMGYADGPGNSAEFYGQEGIGVTPDGATVYVADGNGGDGSPHNRIRAIAIPVQGAL